MTRIVLTLTMLVLLAPAGTQVAQADVLLIEEVRHSENLQLPTNGLSKQEVRAQFGAPANTHAAVGDPPITRWEYQEWSVYFERDLVLFAVLHPGAVIDKGSSPEN